MPPRLSARRLLLIVLFIGGVTVLISLHHHFQWSRNGLNQDRIDDNDDNSNDEDLDNNLDDMDVRASFTTPPILPNEYNDLFGIEATKQNTKPWFMKDGTDYPTNYKGPPRLFPDQADGDRIVDQLMYVPEDYQGKKR